MARSKPEDLPHPETHAGKPRRVGVEIEMGGLDEDRVAEIVADVLGGEIETPDDRHSVSASKLGDIEIYLDTRFRDRLQKGPERAKKIAASVVPVEIVTSPVRPADIARLDELVARLSDAGATGTKDGLLLGFGVHFNPEIRALTLENILPVLTTFALLEDVIRDRDPIDLSRSVLPFVDPYPSALVDALVTAPPATLDDLIDTFLIHAPSRDHALDMTCIFTLHDEGQVAAKMDISGVSARPTFHYRLPDFRPGDPHWSLAAAWNRWVWIETLSEDEDLLRELRNAWSSHREQWFDTRAGWAKRASGILDTYQIRKSA